jgi:hypothetical protein
MMNLGMDVFFKNGGGIMLEENNCDPILTAHTLVDEIPI